MGAVRESIYPQIAENSTVRKGAFHLNPLIGLESLEKNRLNKI